MRHFHRTSLHPDQVLATADEFFPTIGLRPSGQTARTRSFTGVVGTPEVMATLELSVRMEGGHYCFVEAHTDQMGESRMDRNVKKFFVQLKNQDDPRHTLEAAY